MAGPGGGEESKTEVGHKRLKSNRKFDVEEEC